jgi:hypothetical protein
MIDDARNHEREDYRNVLHSKEADKDTKGKTRK